MNIPGFLFVAICLFDTFHYQTALRNRRYITWKHLAYYQTYCCLWWDSDRRVFVDQCRAFVNIIIEHAWSKFSAFLKTAVLTINASRLICHSWKLKLSGIWVIPIYLCAVLVTEQGGKCLLKRPYGAHPIELLFQDLWTQDISSHLLFGIIWFRFIGLFSRFSMWEHFDTAGLLPKILLVQVVSKSCRKGSWGERVKFPIPPIL